MFFHDKATIRKRKNKIEGFEDNIGWWTEDNEEAERIFCKYFQDLFTNFNPSQDQIVPALQGMPSKITLKTNSHLDKPFTVEEIAAALF